MRLTHWFYTIPLRLRSLFRRSRLEQELNEELQFHVERKTQEYASKGLSPKDARHAALREFGGVEQAKENCRDARRVNFIETLFQDLRYGARILRKNPGFTAVAVLTLALGIGANTAIFSLLNALMLRMLPVRDPGQLVELLHRFPGEPHFNGFSWETYQFMRAHNHVLSDLIAVAYQPFVVRGGSPEAQTVVGGYVDGNFFAALGLSPVAGRLIGPEDDDIGHSSAVAVVSWSYWKGKFNLDPAILDRQMILDGVPVTVVGVAPRGFFGLTHELHQDIWLPLALKSFNRSSGVGFGSLGLVGRLKSGVSIDQAQAEIAVLFRSAVDVPSANPFVRKMNFEMEPAGAGLSSPLRQKFATPLLVLMAIVSLLLLLACTNVASLLLARGAARQHEMAVRVCLGAGRLRLLRQVLTESLLLSAAGGLLGIVLAYYGANTLAHIVASGRALHGFTANIEIPVRPDLHVLLFTGGVALLAGLLFGLMPALRALKTVPASALQQSARIGETRSRRFFAKSLVATQVALSIVLLSAAGLFLGYLSSLRNVDLGFRRDHLLLVSLDRTHSTYQNAQFSRMCQELLGRLQGIPGVRSATLSGATPISGGAAAGYATVEGYQERPEDRRYIQISTVAQNYFETYAIPFLAGREFSAQDQGGPRVAIINQAMARYYFGERNAIGKHVTLDHATWHGDDSTYEIVGVVGDAKHNQIREAAPRAIYLDVFQDERVVSQLTVRTSVAPAVVAPEVRRTIGKMLPTVPIARLTTMADQIDESLVPERLIATLSGGFGALGVLLAAIGLYGLLAYTVARRINEIGIRMALGASRSNVGRMVLRDAFTMVCTGLIIGAPLAFWAKSLAASLIQDLPVRSIVPIVFGAVAMIAVALLAAYLPACRAARVDPMVALRYE